MNSQQRTQRSYDRHPYPTLNLEKVADKGGVLPPMKWMQGIGRPGAPAPKRILVAGCGTGVEAFILRRQLPQADIVAVDFSPRSIAVARRFQKSREGVRPILFQVADLTRRNLGSQIGADFDLVTCHGVLSYIPEPKRVMRNFATCVAPGGALYLGVNGEAHPATRLRPWLAEFGLGVNELKEERRLRELLGLWDALNDDGVGELAAMPASYLGGDVCGSHFNNWGLARWRAEANAGGWEVAGTDILPIALQLVMERGRHRLLFAAEVGGLAARLDQARPAGFHRIMLRRGEPGSLDVAFSTGRECTVRWSGLYTVRFGRKTGSGGVSTVFRSASMRLRFEWSLTSRQANGLRSLIASGASPDGWMKSWVRNNSDRELLWLWCGIGAITAA